MISVDVKSREIIVDIPGKKGKLCGILHCPVEDTIVRDTGIIFLHGWSGCRIGPHRMFVNMARTFSQSGYCSVRFDFNGHGESEGTINQSNIQSMMEDVLQVINFMREQRYATRFTLIGICSGSKVAIATATQTDIIKSLVLMSPEPLGSMRTSTVGIQLMFSRLHEYFKKLKDVSTWKKLVKGKVHFKLVRRAILPVEQPTRDEQVQEDIWLEKFKNYSGQILIVYGDKDLPAVSAISKYILFCQTCGISLTTHRVQGANHSFYSVEWEKEIISTTLHWLQQLSGK